MSIIKKLIKLYPDQHTKFLVKSLKLHNKQKCSLIKEIQFYLEVLGNLARQSNCNHKH